MAFAMSINVAGSLGGPNSILRARKEMIALDKPPPGGWMLTEYPAVWPRLVASSMFHTNKPMRAQGIGVAWADTT